MKGSGLTEESKEAKRDGQRRQDDHDLNSKQEIDYKGWRDECDRAQVYMTCRQWQKSLKAFLVNAHFCLVVMLQLEMLFKNVLYKNVPVLVFIC